MKLIYDTAFEDPGYTPDNAGLAGRMAAAVSGLGTHRRDAIAPKPATVEQLLLAHDAAFVRSIQEDTPRFAMASLAAGGAILAARLAHGGEPAFACVRPPGHHASRMGAWGHCTFSNLALALLVLRDEQRIERAFVIDIDAHTGDGTHDVLAHWPQVEVFNPFAATAWEYLELVETRLAAVTQTDILAVSAGFDAYVHDVGHKLDTPDFQRLGTLIRVTAERVCKGRRFAVLEGGYYLRDLGANVRAFCEGFAG